MNMRLSGRRYFPAGCIAAILAIVALFVLGSPDFSAASGKGHGDGGGGHGGGGGGIGIGIGIGFGGGKTRPFWDEEPSGLQRATPPYIAPGTFSDDDDGGKAVKQAPKRRAVVAKPQVVVMRKLVKTPVPYLSELAMDIDQTLLNMVRNEPVQAAKLYLSALGIAKKKKDLYGEQQAYTSLGHVYFLTGRLDRAVSSYQGALKVAEQLNAVKDRAIMLRNLGGAFLASGMYRNANQLNSDALAAFDQLGDRRGAQTVLNNMGVLEKDRGHYLAAVSNYRKALDLDTEKGQLMGLTLTNLGNLSGMWGEYKAAIKNLTAGLEIARSQGDSKQQAEILLNIADVHRQWDDIDKALDATGQAIEAFKRSGVPPDRGLKLMGDLYLDAGVTEKAEPFLKEADYDSSLGRMYLMRHDLPAAQKHYEQLLAASQREDNLEEQFTAYTGLGKVAEEGKSYRKAETNYQKGMDISEALRLSLLPAERRNFFAGRISGFLRCEPAKGLVRVALKQKKPAQSIFPSEATRARDFADNLALKVEGNFFGVPSEILERDLELTNRLASLTTSRTILPEATDKERFSDLSKQIKAVESEKAAFVRMLWKDYKDYASVRHPRPMKLEEIVVGPDEYIVMFDMVGEGLGVRLLKGKKIVDAYLAEIPANDLDAEIKKFRQSFEEAQLEDFDPALAQSLYEKLLAGVLQQIPPGSVVTIVPDGALALLPLETLVVSGKAEWKDSKWGPVPQGLSFVGDFYPLVYQQSLTTMTMVRTLQKKQVSGQRMLVIADPVFEIKDERAQALKQPDIKLASLESDSLVRLTSTIEEHGNGIFKLSRLPGTLGLAKDLQEMYGDKADVYTGLDSTKQAFMTKIVPELNEYRFLVFATHGFAANQLPGIMEPTLALTMVPRGTDGYLTMSEVAGLKMNADVSALTACQTGTGIRLAGEGVLSMGRAFLSAGSRSVLMSLWSVAEQPSVAVMEDFFKRLKEGQSKRQAWNAAVRGVRAGGFDHPFFWGAFIFVGDPD